MRTDRAVVVAGPLRAMPAPAVGGASHAGPMLGHFRGPVAPGLSTAAIPADGHRPGEETPDDTAAALAAFLQENDA